MASRNMALCLNTAISKLSRRSTTGLFLIVLGTAALKIWK